MINSEQYLEDFENNDLITVTPLKSYLKELAVEIKTVGELDVYLFKDTSSIVIDNRLHVLDPLYYQIFDRTNLTDIQKRLQNKTVSFAELHGIHK